MADSLNMPDVAKSQPSLPIPGKLIIPRCAFFCNFSRLLSLPLSVSPESAPVDDDVCFCFRSSLSEDRYTMLGLGDIVSVWVLENALRCWWCIFSIA